MQRAIGAQLVERVSFNLRTKIRVKEFSKKKSETKGVLDFLQMRK